MESKHLPFAILSPINFPSQPRKGLKVLGSFSHGLDTFIAWVQAQREGDLIAFDFETKGAIPHNPHCEVVGLGLANHEEAIYIPVDESSNRFEDLWQALSQCKADFIAHNVPFDSAFFARKFDSKHHRMAVSKFKVCTYAAYKFLATEGWPGQEWGLKPAQLDLLQWSARGDEELQSYMKEHGLDESKMHLVPHPILGKYCCLDAWSTYGLWHQCFNPVMRKWPALDEFFHRFFMPHIHRNTVCYLRGMRIAPEALCQWMHELEFQYEWVHHLILEAFPNVEKGLEEFDRLEVEKVKAKEPAKWKRQKTVKCPSKTHKKDGTPTAQFLKYQEWESTKPEPEETKAWKSWAHKVEIAEEGFHFSWDSSSDKRWLFYDWLKFPIKVWTGKEGESEASVDADAAKGWGFLGELYTLMSEIYREFNFCKAMALSLCMHPHEEGYYLHPQFKIPGTFTQRLSGAGGINFQQLPKSRQFLDCIIPREGHVLLDADLAAVEPHVLAQTSRDETLMSLYGPGAKPHDVYLFLGARIPATREQVLAAGYNEKNPDKESTAAAKKKLKKLRNTIKCVHLAASYGAGAKKIWQSMLLDGVDIEFEEVKQLYSNYWGLFNGVKKFESFLHAQLDANGFLINPIGRPIGIHEMRRKDAVNSSTQSGGHDILVMLDQFLDEQLEHAPSIHWWLPDYHDELVLEVPIGTEESVKLAIKAAEQKLNELLAGDVKIKAEPCVCETFADAKIED